MNPVYGAAAPIYWQLGWRGIIPVDPKDKGGVPKGFTGRDGVDVTRENLDWFARSKPGHNIGLRLPPDIIGIDVDSYDGKTGAATRTEAEKRWGRLPYSPRSTSRHHNGDRVSGIQLFCIPPGEELVDKIKFPELGLGDIEIIQRHHRHAQVWPSIHNRTGQTYEWLGIDGVPEEPPGIADIPDLPAKWLDELRSDRQHTSSDLGDSGERCDVESCLTEGEPTRRVAWRLGEAILGCQGASRHDTTRDHVLALLRYGKQGDTGVMAALKTLQKVFVAAVGPDREGGTDQARGEFRDFIYSDRVARLLAEPDFDDWVHNPQEPPDADDHHTGEWDGESQQSGDEAGGGGTTDADPTTWEPLDLLPWLSGEITQPKPTLGVYRSDGLLLIYPGREHAIVGETESGKTWLVLACVAAEIGRGNLVVYIHYEESDPGSTIERLLLLGVDAAAITARLRFVAPSRPVRAEWVTELLAPAPALVVHDGVNEAMSLIGADIMAADGAAAFRRRLVTPFLRAGAATIACDHLPKNPDGRGRDAYGSVHKGNALDGARFVLENVEPFGRRMRGVSHLYVTKDRPGHLRSRGRTTKTPGKTYMGTLVIDDGTEGPDFFWRLFAPNDDDGDDRPAGVTVTPAELAEAMYHVIAALPNHTAESARKLHAEMRKAGHKFRESAYRTAVDDLIVAGRVVEVQGKRGAAAYSAVVTAAQEKSE
jgi:Bifunctional DNA primase/polymerase, N-terminal